MNTFLGAIGAFLLVVGVQGAALNSPIHAVMILLGLISIIVGFGQEFFG